MPTSSQFSLHIKLFRPKPYIISHYALSQHILPNFDWLALMKLKHRGRKKERYNERKTECKQLKINKQGGKRERKKPITKSNKYSSFVSQDFSLTTSTDPSQFTEQLKVARHCFPPPPTPPSRLPDD